MLLVSFPCIKDIKNILQYQIYFWDFLKGLGKSSNCFFQSTLFEIEVRPIIKITQMIRVISKAIIFKFSFIYDNSYCVLTIILSNNIDK